MTEEQLRKRAHYEAHKDEYMARSREQKKRMYQLVNDIKMAGSCVDCGRKFPPVCMDFDHRDASKKIGNVAALVSHGSVQKLLDEIDKCDLVCSNCHRIRTKARFRVTSLRGAMTKYDDLMLVLGVLEDEEEIGIEILQPPSIERALLLTDELRTDLEARIIE